MSDSLADKNRERAITRQAEIDSWDEKHLRETAAMTVYLLFGQRALEVLVTPTPSAGEEVQAAMALAEAVDLYAGSMVADAVTFRETPLVKIREALSRYRASKPAPSGGRGGA